MGGGQHFMQKNNALQNLIVYFTRQRFACAIIDAETLQSLFVNIWRIFVISRRTWYSSCILFS